MLSLTGKIKASSLFPQYLITAMFVGVCAVVISTHFSAAISLRTAEISTSPIKESREEEELKEFYRKRDSEEENAGDESRESEICGVKSE